jgi:hypothetical protein
VADVPSGLSLTPPQRTKWTQSHPTTRNEREREREREKETLFRVMVRWPAGSVDRVRFPGNIDGEHNIDALMNHRSINKYAKSKTNLFGPHSKDRAINT